MSICTKMNRPCNCGKVFVYDRNGQVKALNNAASCLSDGEIRSVLTVVLQEWRKRIAEIETRGRLLA